MRNCFVIAALCFYAFSAKAQDSIPKPIYYPIIASWKLGDTLRYERTKGEKIYENGVVKDSTESKDKLALVVAASTDTTYIIRVLYHSNPVKTILDAGLTGRDVLKAMVIPEFAQLEYVTDEMGALLRFNNIDKFYRAYTMLFDSIVAQKHETEAEQTKMANTLAKLKSKAYFEALFLQEIRTLHKFYGYQFAQDSMGILLYQIINPLNPEDTLTLVNQVTASMPEDWNGLLQLRNYVTIEDEAAISLLTGLFSEASNLHEIENKFEQASPTSEIYNSYAIYPGDGVLDSMYSSTSYYFGDKLLRERYVYLSLVQE